ncbi:MAG: lipoyl(octanoyl) transferase LipB [Bacteroidetes bacterium]|nr:lipoyl(octanoyl) transferase LipB [Bacteroidota bacterium]
MNTTDTTNSVYSLPLGERRRGAQVLFRDLGLIDYKECWDYQEKLLTETISIKSQNRILSPDSQLLTPNYFLFCEHPHVYTLGKSGDEKNLLLNETQLKNKNATYYKINRGGDITYHGPGQIVGYPILDLDNFFTDIHKYLRYLEETIILTLKDYGIESGRIEGLTGVWLDWKNPAKARKICALGVRTSRWVTMHGFAFNVNSDLSYFNNIIPCGIQDKAVTSMQKELGREINMKEVKEKVKKYFAQVFECEIV